MEPMIQLSRNKEYKSWVKELAKTIRPFERLEICK